MAQAVSTADDISDKALVEGSVDGNTEGVYTITYSISVTNALGEESTVSKSRFIAVVNSEIDDIDLSGMYSGDGTSVSGAWTQTATITSVTRGWYATDKALASGNNLGITFAHINKSTLVVPSQSTGFGTVNTTNPDTNAQINPDGFQWTLFISCCGNFGPIIFTN